MIRDLDVILDGAILVRAPSALGVVAALVERAKRSPWLIFEGATARFATPATGYREIEITPKRWQYIQLRAQEELPDPGYAENVVEYLWSDDLDVEPPVMPLTRGGLSVVPHAVIRIDAGRHRAEWRVDWSPMRDAWRAAHLYLDIVRHIANECPPEIEVTPAVDNPHRAFQGQPQAVLARCVGCDEHKTFGGAAAQKAREAMQHQHGLCGVRHAAKIERSRTSRAYSPLTATGADLDRIAGLFGVKRSSPATPAGGPHGGLR